MESREKVLADHRAQIAVLDVRAAQATQALLDRQRSLAVRVVGLVRGRKHHLGQQTALRARFETLRIAKRRQLKQLQGRQDAAKRQTFERGQERDRRHTQEIKHQE